MPEFPIELSRRTFVNERGGDSERIREIREHECPECGYDRAVAERNTYLGAINAFRCQACENWEPVYIPTEELGDDDGPLTVEIVPGSGPTEEARLAMVENLLEGAIEQGYIREFNIETPGGES